MVCRMEECHTILECWFDGLQRGAICFCDFGLEVDVDFLMNRPVFWTSSLDMPIGRMYWNALHSWVPGYTV